MCSMPCSADCTAAGRSLALDEPVINVQRDGDGFRLETNNRTHRLRPKLIVTTGGKSYPGCGTTGDGYRWLAELGHTIRRPRPALVPLTSDEPWIAELSGITVPDVLLRVVEPTTE